MTAETSNMFRKSLWILLFASSLKLHSAHGLRNFEPHEMAIKPFEIAHAQQTAFEGRSGYADSPYAVSANGHEKQRRPVSGWTAFTPAWLHDREALQDQPRPTPVTPRVALPPHKGQSSYHAPGFQDVSYWDRHESRHQGFVKEEAVPVQVNPVLTQQWHQEEDWRQKTFFQPEQLQENAGVSRPASPASRTQPKPQPDSSRYDTQRPQSPPQNHYYDYAETPQQQFYNPGPPPPYYPAKATQGKHPEVAYDPPRQPAPILRDRLPVTPRPSPPTPAPPRNHPSNANTFPNPHVPNLSTPGNNGKHFAQEPIPYQPTHQSKPPSSTNRQKPEYPQNNYPTLKNPSEYPKYPVGPERQPAPPSDFTEDPYKDMISLKRQNRPTPPRTTTTQAPPRVITPDPYKDLIVYKRKPATQPPLPSYDESLDYQAPYLEPYNDVPAAPEVESHPYSSPILDEDSDSYAPVSPAEDTRPYNAPEPVRDPYQYASPVLEEHSEPEAPLDVIEETGDEEWPVEKPYEELLTPKEEDRPLSVYDLSGLPPVRYPLQPVAEDSSANFGSPYRHPGSSFDTDEADDDVEAELPSVAETESPQFKPTTFRPSTTTAPIITTKASTTPSLTRSRLKTRLPSTNTRTQSVKVDVDLPAKSKTGSAARGQDSVVFPVLKDAEHPEDITESTPTSLKSNTEASMTTIKAPKATKPDHSGGRIAAYRQRLDQLREQANKNRDLSKIKDTKVENDIQSSSPKNVHITRGTTTTTSTTRRPAVSRTRPRFPTRNRLGDDDQRSSPVDSDKKVQQEEKPTARKQPSATETPTTSTRRTFTPRWRSTTTTTSTEPDGLEEPVKEAPSGENLKSDTPWKQRNHPYRRKPGLRRRIPSTTTESPLVLEEEEKEEEEIEEYKATPWKRSSTSKSPSTTTTEIPDMSHESTESKQEDERPVQEYVATSTLSTTSTITSSTNAIITASTSTTIAPEETSLSASSSSTWVNTPRTFGVEPWVGQSVEYESQVLDVPKPENMMESESSILVPKLTSYPKFPANIDKETDEPVIELVEEIPAGVTTTKRTETGDLENQESLKDILSKWRSSTSTTTEQIGQPWLQYTEHLFEGPMSSEKSHNNDSMELLESSDGESVGGFAVTSSTAKVTTAKHNWQFSGPTQAPFLPIEQLLPVRRSTKKPKSKASTPPSE